MLAAFAARVRHWPALVLALVAAGVAAWARHKVFPAMSWNRDEGVYLWQVDTLRAGRLRSDDGGHPELFLPWLSAARDGGLFSQYTLGWPLVLLASVVLTGSATLALSAGAALAVVGTYAFAMEVTRRRRTASVAAAVMVASPIMAIQGGVHLSYLFTLGLGLLFGTGLLSGLRTGRMGRVLGAGVLLGWIFFTRPYDGLLWGLAFGGYALVVERLRWTRVVRPFLLVGAGALPLVLATLAYNRHVTGAPLAFPITEADPLDTFGFGQRRLMPGFPITDYSLGSGLKALAKHAFFFPWFLLGAHLGVLVAAAGAWVARRRRSTLLVLLVGAVFPLGYLPFWGTQESSQFTRIAGPVYYVPIFAGVAVLIAVALVHLHERQPRAAAALLTGLVVATVPTGLSRVQVNQELSRPQDGWRTSVEAIDGRALVFVGDAKRYLLFLNPFGSNGPELDDRLLYSVDQQPSMLDLIAEHPDRTPYLQLATEPQEDLGPKEAPVDFDVLLQPVEVRRGRLLSLDVATGAVPGRATVEAEVDGRGVRRTGAAGGAVESISVGPAGSGADLELPDRGILRITQGYGDDPSASLASPAAQVRLVFRVVDGEVEVLLPAGVFEWVELDETSEWRRRVSTAHLSVAVRPASDPRSG